MKKGTKISVTLEIKDENGEVISSMTNRKGKIIEPANDQNTKYFVLFNGQTTTEVISKEYITVEK